MKRRFVLALVSGSVAVVTLVIAAASPRTASAKAMLECVSWQNRIHDNTWPIFNDYIHATASGADAVPAPPGWWEANGFVARSDLDGTHGSWLSGQAQDEHSECTTEG